MDQRQYVHDYIIKFLENLNSQIQANNFCPIRLLNGLGMSCIFL